MGAVIDRKLYYKKKPGWYIMQLNKQKWTIYIDRTFDSKEEAEEIRAELLVTYPPDSHWWRHIRVRQLKS